MGKVWDVFCEIKTDLYPTPFCPCHVVRNMFVDYTLKITTTSPRGQWVSDFIWGSRHLNSSRSSDAIWQHRSGSTLAQVMACCLTAPSHYLNQRWFIVSEVLWHAPERNFTVIDQVDILYSELENYNVKIIVTCRRGQWVNLLGGCVILDVSHTKGSIRDWRFTTETSHNRTGTHKNRSTIKPLI